MNPLYRETLALRSAGYSYNEIHERLGVAKSTLSGWLKEVPLSDSASARLKSKVYQGTVNGLVKRNKLQTLLARQRAAELQKRASARICTLKENDLLLIGTALYWAEGYKRPIVRYGRELTSHSISFVNADPVMIQVFILFLRKILNISSEKIILYMRLYEGMDEKKAFAYWSEVTGLPKAAFRKTTFLVSVASKRLRPPSRLPHGTLQIHVADTKKFHTLIGFIEGMKARL